MNSKATYNEAERIEEEGLRPDGGEDRRKKSRMCAHFAAVEYQIKRFDMTTVKKKPHYFVFSC